MVRGREHALATHLGWICTGSALANLDAIWDYLVARVVEEFPHRLLGVLEKVVVAKENTASAHNPFMLRGEGARHTATSI